MMKQNQKICERILKAMERKNVNPEYKKMMLWACDKSKKLKYKVSPYELNYTMNYVIGVQ